MNFNGLSIGRYEKFNIKKKIIHRCYYLRMCYKFTSFYMKFTKLIVLFNITITVPYESDFLNKNCTYNIPRTKIHFTLYVKVLFSEKYNTYKYINYNSFKCTFVRGFDDLLIIIHLITSNGW